jgi:hypothetical protein
MTKILSLHAALALAASVTFAHPAAHAAVVQTAGDFAKGTPYYGSSAYLVAGPASAQEGQSGQQQSSLMAGQFFATKTGTLSSLQLALGCATGFPGIAVALVTDNRNTPNESQPPLEEWTLTSVTTSCTGKIVKLVSKKQPAINAGQFYWLVVTPIGWDTSVYWFLNNIGASGGQWSLDGGSSWSTFATDPAFAVSVTQP